jgi:hypothetical protein
MQGVSGAEFAVVTAPAPRIAAPGGGGRPDPAPAGPLNRFRLANRRRSGSGWFLWVAAVRVLLRDLGISRP